MSIKRLAYMIMGLVLILALAACGKTDNTDKLDTTDNHTSSFLEGLKEAGYLNE